MMKKLLIIALCVAIPMVGFAQKKAKKGKKAQEEVVVEPVVEVLDDEECLMLLSLSHESVKAEQYDDAYKLFVDDSCLWGIWLNKCDNCEYDDFGYCLLNEEKYDGYYSIVTSELNMSDQELRNKYRGLSKIEDTFKLTKSELEARPVLVWTKEHIESHFLTCFVSLIITRLLEKKLKKH